MNEHMEPDAGATSHHEPDISIERVSEMVAAEPIGDSGCGSSCSCSCG